jgi:ribosomal-protein-alanine N-acetyltransferase
MHTILTARLTLRPFTLDAVDEVHALWTDPDVRRFLWDNVVIARERAEEMVRAIVAGFHRNGRGMWLIHETSAAKPCGFCGFLPRKEPDRAELIYGLAPGAWGRGYATESARAVMEYGFETLNLPKIAAAADVPNLASLRVLERLGMRFVRREVVHGVDLLFYEIENTAPAADATESPRTPRRSAPRAESEDDGPSE